MIKYQTTRAIGLHVENGAFVMIPKGAIITVTGTAIVLYDGREHQIECIRPGDLQRLADWQQPLR